MSNALTSAAHGLTLAEKRIMMLSVGKLDSRRAHEPTNPPVVKITAAEYADTFGVDPDTAYNQLQAGSEHLFKRQIGFQRPGGRKGPIVVRMRWVGSVQYHKGEGWAELAFWHEVVPHLMGLQKQFTSYKLAQASSLRSIYSWRLLELLKQYEATGWREMDIEEFCHAVEATEKQQRNFAAIRRRIIEPAVRELTEKDGWIIQWKPINAGRRVRALRFDLRRDPQGRLL